MILSMFLDDGGFLVGDPSRTLTMYAPKHSRYARLAQTSQVIAARTMGRDLQLQSRKPTQQDRRRIALLQAQGKKIL